ncbi:Ionotropic receptor 180, partial [Diabrotica virgifera virgifera]
SVVYTQDGKLLGWYPYHIKSDCGKAVNPVNLFDEIPFENRIPRNLNGCPVSISWNMYAIFMWNPFNDTYPGALFLAMNTISEVMNFTPNYLINNSDFLVDYLKTDTFDTAERDMSDRNIDLILYGSDNGEHVDLNKVQDLVKGVTYSVLQTTLLKKRANFYFSYFGPYMLTSFTLMLIVFPFLWKHIAGVKYYGDAALTVYRMLFQLQILKLKRSFKVKVLFIGVLIWIYFIDLKYTSLLGSLLTSPGKIQRLGSTSQPQKTL